MYTEKYNQLIAFLAAGGRLPAPEIDKICSLAGKSVGEAVLEVARFITKPPGCPKCKTKTTNVGSRSSKDGALQIQRFFCPTCKATIKRTIPRSAIRGGGA